MLNSIKKNSGEIYYLLSQYSTPVLGFLVNILIMRFIEPAILGSFKSIFIYSTYFSFIQLGVFNGLNRNLSFYKGKGDFKKLIISTSTGFVFTIIVSLISILITILMSYSSLNDGSSTIRYSLLFLGVFVAISPFRIFLEALYRTGQDFKKLARIIAVENFTGAFSILFILFFGFIGYLIQQTIKILVGTYLRFKGKLRVLRIKFKWKVLKEQINTGFLIMINTYLFSTFFVFDEFYIAKEFDKVELGYFNLARLVLFIIPIIPNSLTTILYPKASLLYGKTNGDKNALRPFFKNSLLINLGIIIPFLIILLFIIEPITTFFLPKYVNGINYAKLTLWGGLGFMMVGPTVILGVLKKTRFNFFMLVIINVLTYGIYFLNYLNLNSIDNLIFFKNILFLVYSVSIIFYTFFLLYKKEKLI